MRNHRLPALRTIALIIIAVWGSAGHAAGLGSVRVQSSLGQPLRVSIPMLGEDGGEIAANCVKARLEHSDGVFISGAQVAFSRANHVTTIHLATRQPVNEPAVAVHVEVTCGMSIQRTYQVLLDPVLILPQVAQSERAGRDATLARNVPVPLPAVVPSNVSSRVTEPRQRQAAQRTRSVDAASPPISVDVESLKADKRTRTSRREEKKVVRNVLKLSGDEIDVYSGATFSSGLKLSESLSESRDTGDPQRAAELRAAYLRFAAVLRGEDPVQNGELQIQAMQVKLQELEKQTVQIREQAAQQQQSDRAAMDRMRSEMFSSRWITGLGGLLLAALAALGWLVWRSQQEASRRKQTAFWEKTVIADDDEPREWDETLLPVDAVKVVTAKTANALKTPGAEELAPTDWEKGVPFDNTLAVDWAAQQGTLQNESHHDDTVQPAVTVSGNPDHEATMPGPRHDVPSARPARPVAEADKQVAFPRLVNDGPEHKEGLSLGKQPAIARTDAPAPASPAIPDVSAAQAPVKQAVGMSLLQVEELSGMMQEAEFWMLLNDSHRAIEILEPYADVKRPMSPVPWIYLLDLYRVVGHQQKYEALGERIKQVFNTSAPAWDEPINYATARSIEDYPHVIEAIQDLWEGDYIVPYLESLLFDDRDGARTGFDLAVYREIIHLIGIASDPKTLKRRTHLQFEKSQPRLISQQVTSAEDKSAASGGESIGFATSDDVDVFDRAMSKQVTSKQVLPKLSVPKPASQPTSLPPLPPAAPFASAAPEAPPAAASPDVDTFSVAPPAESVRSQAAAPSTAPAVVPGAGAATPGVPAAATATAVEEAIKAKRAAFAAQQKSVAVAPEAELADSDEDDHFADMARKMDLAIAYQEIGESVGARVLLEEVIQGGTPIQGNKAKAMLRKLLKDIDWQ